MELPESIIALVREHFPSKLEDTDHWNKQIAHAFMSQDINGQWQTFIGCIDKHSMTYLSLTAELLASKANTKLIADEQILELRTKLQELLNEALKAEIPKEVRDFLVRYLRKLVNCIDEYSIGGAMPILEASSALMGHMIFDEKYRDSMLKTSFGEKVLSTLGAVADAVTVAGAIPGLTAIAMPLLTNLAT